MAFLAAGAPVRKGLVHERKWQVEEPRVITALPLRRAATEAFFVVGQFRVAPFEAEALVPRQPIVAHRPETSQGDDTEQGCGNTTPKASRM